VVAVADIEQAVFERSCGGEEEGVGRHRNGQALAREGVRRGRACHAGS
jgi:hypothetical protein